MRIVYIVNNINQVQGVQRVVCNLASYFADTFGYDVCIHSLNTFDGKPYFELSSKVQVVHHCIDWETETRLSTLRSVRKIMKNCKADLIITVNTTISDAVLLNRHVCSAKIIVTEHRAVTNYSPWRRRLNTIVYPLADKVVMLTNDDCRHYRGKNITAIANALPFQPDKGSSLDRNVIISVGRLEYVKGFDMLIDAFRIVHRRYPDWKMRILGDGTMRTALTSRIEAAGLQDHVDLPGFVDNIQQEYMEASVNVIASRSEGFSLALIEAMTCGLPCITFDLPSMQEILANNAGVLVPCNDVNALAEAMCQMVGSEENRHFYAEAARIRSSDFTLAHVCAQWNNLFTELMGDMTCSPK